MEGEIDLDTKDVTVQIRPTRNGRKGDYWPLAQLGGGVEKITVKQRETPSGLKTTIEFLSQGGEILTPQYDRAKMKRAIARDRVQAAKAEIG